MYTNNQCGHRDHLGNIREVLDANGAVCQYTNYYAFGAPFCMPGTYMGASLQPYKYNGKELDLMHGLNTYDYGARQYYPVVPVWDRMDPLCEKYYGVSPYAYCANNPVNHIDTDGRSTWVINKGDGKYQVVGGNLNDKDKNIYVGTFNKKGEFIRGNSIGITTSLTSFFDSDVGHWSTKSIINTNDKSGNKFLERIFSENPPMIDDYMMNARNNK